MKQENRHQAILYAVMRQGYVSIESLAEELGVSSQTIRRDISELDRTGMLERRPGGASCRTTILNSTYDARQVEDFKDVVYIARNPEMFVPLCDAAAKENRPAWTEKRLGYGAVCSWAERVHQMEDVLYKKGVLHES